MPSLQLQEMGAYILNLQLKINAVTEQHFKSLWDKVLAVSQQLDFKPPSLPRQRKVPRCMC